MTDARSKIVAYVLVAALLLFVVFVVSWWFGRYHSDPGWGYFSRNPVVELQDDGRVLLLLSDFSYTDPDGKVWVAPTGSLINGASIPRAFWTVVGGPLEGLYRNASIIHDVACDTRMGTSAETHLMFYQACRCGGVPERQAKILYAAVYHFGPRWTKEGVQAFPQPLPEPTKEQVLQMANTIERENLTIADIQQMVVSK